MQLSLKEFKDRRLYRAAVGCAVAAWLTLQVLHFFFLLWTHHAGF